jgi:hypothetical protein
MQSGPWAFAGLAVTFGVPALTRVWGDSNWIPMLLLACLVGGCVAIVALSSILFQLGMPTSLGDAGKVLSFILSLFFVLGLFVAGFLLGV